MAVASRSQVMPRIPCFLVCNIPTTEPKRERASDWATDRGQGFNNAIKDASDIVDAIKAALAETTPLAEGITAYEDEMRVRGSTEVDLSFKQMLASNAKDLIGSPMFTMGHAKNDGSN